ncbi:MAG: glutathione S-transferase [Spongiibacteraceae bacterium]
MRLIGMLDSPYVRRTAISLDLLGISFTHEAVSVFKDFEHFKTINAVVKAPTLVCDDGEVLMDSSLILQFIEAIQPLSLWSSDVKELQHEMRAVSLALAACDKCVQLIYERNLRPANLHYEPWKTRVTQQILAAFSALEREVALSRTAFENTRSQASVTSAVVWQFAQSMLSTEISADLHPNLVQLSAGMEMTPPFLRYQPQGPGVPAK